jgi:prepilin peptidase CpaA
MMMNLFQLLAVAIALMATAWDLSTRRIPNALTFGAAFAAFAVHGYLGGLDSLALAAVGWIVGVAVFFPIFALGGMGAGDVKLLGAVGAWLGPVAVIWVALYSGIAGGLLGLVVAAWSGYLRQAVANIYSMVIYWRVVGLKPVPDLTLSSHSGPRLAYAVPILAGVMVTLWLQ